jgi:hypothetical protein
MMKPLDILKAGLQALWKLTETRKRKLNLWENQDTTESDEAEVEMKYDYNCHASMHAHRTYPETCGAVVRFSVLGEGERVTSGVHATSLHHMHHTLIFVHASRPINLTTGSSTYFNGSEIHVVLPFTHPPGRYKAEIIQQNKGKCEYGVQDAFSL